MCTVKELLRNKESIIWSIHPKATVINALQLMAQKDIGALPVLDEMGLVGIISERDFVHMIAETHECKMHATIDNYMTKEVITTIPDATVSECMLIMTTHHIRHLPIVENNQLIGLISIGDVVRQVVSEKDTTIQQMENYISGRGYGQ
ncbi:MAG: histidine kinase [Chloroflexi bacterium HGW-Chloroflexi-10]|nr:MAG: histidine kinase [Chloroflexi bacterium HGW-Chloroflexi-10]